jgi:uncharacterized Zn finger protein
MSPWDSFFKYERAAKKPPPEHGIKLKKAGTTWWGQRWIEALEKVLRGDSGRLGRGRTYARAGRTHDLIVKAGQVSAKVTGSRPKPYEVTIRLAQLSTAEWDEAIRGMAAKAQFAAALLAGEMPQEIDEVFQGAGKSLFPLTRGDLTTSCTCPDWGDPCKHVAATHYVLGEALDRDPFLLFEMRGRSKTLVIDALRLARAGERSIADEEGVNAGGRTAALEVPRVTLGQLSAEDYDRPRESMPDMQFSFDEPVVHGAVLRQLGAPRAWGAEGSPAEAFAPLVRAAAERARALALAEPAESSEPEKERASRIPSRGRRESSGKTKSREAPRKDPSQEKRPRAPTRSKR